MKTRSARTVRLLFGSAMKTADRRPELVQRFRHRIGSKWILEDQDLSR